MKAVSVENLSIELDDGGGAVVDEVTLSLEQGSVMGLVGESGSGKTSLALALAAYTTPGVGITRGSVAINGVDLLALGGSDLRTARKRVIGYVPQDPSSALNPALRIGTQLLEGMVGEKSANLARVREVLQSVGLPCDDAFLRRQPRKLSGGQQQRVTIAMAVAKGASVIVLDEPTTGLDVSTQAMVLKLVKGLCADSGLSAVIVSHDLAVVGDVADVVAVMYGGQVVETGLSKDVLANPEHPYTRALLDCVPSTHERFRLMPIPGRPRGAGERGDGCVFRERCSFADDSCSKEAPSLATVTANGHQARCLRLDQVRSGYVSPSRIPARQMDEDGPRVLAIEHLDAWYGGKQVLFDVSLGIGERECLAVVGESGSGKTTMSRCLIGLHEEQSGSYLLEGEELSAQLSSRSMRSKQSVQYIFQNPYGSLNPRQTIGAAVAVPLKHFFGQRGREAQTHVREALDRVEIPWRLADHYPRDLSGGQRQRVAIARALVCRPKLLVCDEITSGLDVSVQASVVELLRSLQDDGLAMMFVTHNLAVVRSIADRVVVLNEGHSVESGPVGTVLDAPNHSYTRQLLADAVEVSRA